MSVGHRGQQERGRGAEQEDEVECELPVSGGRLPASHQVRECDAVRAASLGPRQPGEWASSSTKLLIELKLLPILNGLLIVCLGNLLLNDWWVDVDSGYFAEKGIVRMANIILLGPKSSG